MYQYMVFGDFQIPSYGLMMTIGFFLCGSICLIKAKRIGVGIDEMIIVIVTSLGMALLGAGALYIIVSYKVEELIDMVISGNFSFLKKGGLVFYGGLCGGVIGAFIALKWQKIDVQNIEECIVPVIPLGHAVGRIGCLFAGCCHGMEYYGVFAVKNLLVSSEKTYFPIQGVEAILNLGLFIYLLWYVRKKRPAYCILCTYLFVYSILRFTLEFFRGDLIRGNFFMFSTSQWISIFLFFICISRFILIKKTKYSKN